LIYAQVRRVEKRRIGVQRGKGRADGANGKMKIQTDRQT